MKVVGSHQNMVDDILAQLAKHAETMESLVAARTAELITEMQKVDRLLQEMLPMYGRTFATTALVQNDLRESFDLQFGH